MYPLVDTILAARIDGPDQLLPTLHAIQDALGFIPPETVPAIALSFNLSRAEVHGVLTFYHHFRSTPPARCIVQLCRAEACQSMGADALLAHAEQALRERGSFAIEPVYCLGQCATAPAMMVGEAVHARVTPARFDRIIARLEETA
jgi:formate dehydrogenase subunit gamma